MSKSILFFIILIAMIVNSNISAKTVDEYMKQAGGLVQNNQYNEAVMLMTEATKEYPDSSNVWFALGEIIAAHVQVTREYQAILGMIESIFTVWEKALELDPQNFNARFNRGAWAVSVPKMYGQLETGLEDMNMMVNALEQMQDPSLKEQLLKAYQFLAIGYQKIGEYEAARQLLQRIIDNAPGSESADYAQTSLNDISRVEVWYAARNQQRPAKTQELVNLENAANQNANDPEMIFALARAYYDLGYFEEASMVFRHLINLDPDDILAYQFLAMALQQIASQGYDPRISLDTDFRTDIAFEIINVLDEAVDRAPDNLELKLMRGIASIEMPFFVNRLPQGTSDLQAVVNSNAPDDMRSEAIFYLGLAYQKLNRKHWIKLATEYPESEAARAVFNQLRPAIATINESNIPKPAVIINFVLGFQDELPPQTAVWIEDQDRSFIKTIYVSGFSGHARTKQVNLPVYANASKFSDVDGVTGASVDLGQQVFFWDLKDSQGNLLKKGDFFVVIEVAFWPSMLYQKVEVPFTVGKKDMRQVLQESELTPLVEVKYIRK